MRPNSFRLISATYMGKIPVLRRSSSYEKCRPTIASEIRIALCTDDIQSPKGSGENAEDKGMGFALAKELIRGLKRYPDPPTSGRLRH